MKENNLALMESIKDPVPTGPNLEEILLPYHFSPTGHIKPAGSCQNE
jgi:hypothetical protein